jgi:hypothetical protein
MAATSRSGCSDARASRDPDRSDRTFTLLSVAMLIAGNVDRALVSLLVALLSLSVAVPVAAFGSEEGTQLKRRHTPF